MTKTQVVADVMSTDFVSGTEPPLLRAAVARRVDGTLAVLVGADGEPQGLVGPAGAWPALVVSAETPVAGLLASAVVLRAVLDGVPAMIAVRDDRVVGVLPAQTLTALLDDELLRTRPGTALGLEARSMGLPDVPSTPLRIRCDVCGETNSLREWSEGTEVECASRDHLFVPYWSR
ncbi:hypothetical protein [Streptomyces avermitilis]|uniref:CBS domain-containing protein n=1 Tax=Streptomyces avermitilis TaxID=33903 RepID=A0A4D4M9X8_STRAX|nr:hypothetical protein [Streptomyces avermitilis]GDY68668.1 hypothetical protein SAV14893_080610 [Streptomyces avermitilis]GDY70957.1 hypothetical protein SAV31267_004420 [Streptomyces avermitilis]